ncbi:unnamed protein product, partial [Prorocentrum cordatum]
EEEVERASRRGPRRRAAPCPAHGAPPCSAGRAPRALGRARGVGAPGGALGVAGVPLRRRSGPGAAERRAKPKLLAVHVAHLSKRARVYSCSFLIVPGPLVAMKGPRTKQ